MSVTAMFIIGTGIPVLVGVLTFITTQIAASRKHRDTVQALTAEAQQARLDEAVKAAEERVKMDERIKRLEGGVDAAHDKIRVLQSSQSKLERSVDLIANDVKHVLDAIESQGAKLDRFIEAHAQHSRGDS